nr:HAD hydrolase family protein [Desulfobulbaceae bacterium]
MNGCAGSQEQPYSGDCDFTEFLLRKAASRSESSALPKDELLGKAKIIKLLLLDVDGVLTNGSITYTHQGDEIKSFHCRDGFGINILKKTGVEVGLITARKSESLLRRAKDLSLTHVYQGVRNKVECFSMLLEQLSLEPSQVAFMGDDWLDLALLTKVGLAAAVADCAPELKGVVHFVSVHNGGTGAVRELCDLIIEAKGKRESLLTEYLNRK